MARVLVAMSGGVDSSVAAALLHEAGHEVVGVTLHLWDASGAQQVGRCCAPEDREDARRSADALGVPHYVLDEREAFAAEVVDPFVRAYLEGTTPSPCVVCNQHVKLGRLIGIADRLGCTHLSTGHYARIEVDAEGTPRLYRGADPKKDQSYFLYGVAPSILARMILPLGGLTKDQTRAEGQRLGVPNWDKKDSQELCFVPDGDVAGFVRRRAPGQSRSGRIIDETGAEVGRHEGLEAFTVGQRRGLGLGGGPPRYVLRILPNGADVEVGGDAALAQSHLHATGASWLHAVPEAFDAAIQIRHHHRPEPARVERDPDGFRATFASPQRAVSPGQAAVVYLRDEVLGGGIIT